MSYLNPLRLHFAGKFQASVSTVNNDAVHYDNATFIPDYQKMGTNTSPNGWWNPRGDAAWRLIGCQVTSAWMADGQAAAKNDPIRSYLIADSDRAAPAKLVDLDPEQQLVSQIWGLEVRICDQGGNTLLRGQYDPVGFMDIWVSNSQASGDGSVSAIYQSVLTDLAWGNISSSPFLQALRAAAIDGLLSIKFNVDSYNTKFGTPDFTLGRIAGTIGPATATEPRHFVQGRQLLASGAPQEFFQPTNQINFCVAVVDQQRKKIYLDLGNALPTTGPQGQRKSLGLLSVGYVANSNNYNLLDTIAESVYTNPEWYTTTAGVVELPASRSLTADELQNIAANPLAIQISISQAQAVTAVAEDPNGWYIRADQFVFRVSPGEQAQAKLYATQFGQPYPQARIISILDPSQLQPGTLIPNVEPPDVATPPNAISFPSLVVTDENGVAWLSINAHDPGNPRGYIDGQVYGVRPMLEATLIPGANYQFNIANLISLLVWGGFQPDEPITWYGSLQPIFQQYANLYPVMQDFLDLSSYDSVCANLSLLQLAFGLAPSNPNAMPTMRDLSAAKRRAILRWMRETGKDGLPLKGVPPAAAPAAAAPAAAAPAADASAASLALQGGKTAAVSRMRGARPRRRKG